MTTSTNPPVSFVPLILETGLLLDLSHDAFPTRVFGWKKGALALAEEATHYGMVTQGEAVLRTPLGTYRLQPGMFFVLPGGGTIEPGAEIAATASGRTRAGDVGEVAASPACSGLVISRLGYRGLRQVGGPLEEAGRLGYIDGCSDTLLVCPPVLGEPCLNHLHIPPHTRQTAHTHPSVRLGVILRGQGECHTPEGSFALSPGMAWYIPTECLHAFYTTDASLDVIAWHPDSDFGPTHVNHPMVNRTFVEGKSASQRPDIQTGTLPPHAGNRA
jgi:quercetin dioxygenase-like cupin family protein